MRLRIVVLCVVVALTTWAIALFVAYSIPGSPFQEELRVVKRLADPETGPAAFPEFLRIAKRTQLIAAIAFPLAAAVVVALLSRIRVHLNRREALIVVLLFSAFLVVSGGGVRSFDATGLASIAIFGFVVALGVRPLISAGGTLHKSTI